VCIGGSVIIILIKFVVGEEDGNGDRSFVGKTIISEGLRVEFVGAALEHLLRIVKLDGCSLDTEVVEHGIRFPPT
jgi:hypothetical protein